MTGTTLAAKVLAMRADLAAELRQTIDGIDGRLGIDELNASESGKAALVVEVTDFLIERGWVSEHPDAGQSPYQPDPPSEGAVTFGAARPDGGA